MTNLKVSYTLQVLQYNVPNSYYDMVKTCVT